MKPTSSVRVGFWHPDINHSSSSKSIVRLQESESWITSKLMLSYALRRILTHLECLQSSIASCSPSLLCWCLLILNLLHILNRHQEEMTLLSFLYNKKTSLINSKWIFKKSLLAKSPSTTQHFCQKPSISVKNAEIFFYLTQNGKSCFMLQFDIPFVQ